MSTTTRGAFAVALLIAGFLVASADAQDCVCYSKENKTDMVAINRFDYKFFGSSTNDWNHVNPNGTNACPQPNDACSFTFKYSGSDMDSWRVSKIVCQPDDANVVYLYDDKNDPSLSDKKLLTCNGDWSVAYLKSTEISVKIDGRTTKFYGWAEPADSKLLPTGEPTTPSGKKTTTTTPAASRDPITADAAKLQLDLAIAIDATYIDGPPSGTFDRMRDFGANFASSFDVHADQFRIKGTRASLLWLLDVQTGSSSSFWSFEDPSTLADAIKGFEQFPAIAGNATYGKALENFLTFAFNASANDGRSQPPRANAERVLVIFTAKDSMDSKTNLSTVIDNNDVHTIVVNFGEDPLVNLKTMLGDSIYEANVTGGATVVSLLKYILDGNQLCGQPDMIKDHIGGVDVYKMNSPNFSPIALGKPDSFSSGRYCNSQNVTFDMTNDAGKKFIKMTAIYELETGSDRICVLHGENSEEAVWTGFDISETELCFQTKADDVVKVHFESDSKQVFRGFQIFAMFVDDCAIPFPVLPNAR